MILLDQKRPKMSPYRGRICCNTTYYICTFLVKGACTCIFCFHQTPSNLVLSVCWVLLCITSWSKNIMLFICENTDLENLQVDINSFKSVQQFGNALWFTTASSVDESFHDEAFASFTFAPVDHSNTLPVTCTFQIVKQGPCHCFDETALSNCFPCKLMQELWNHRS